MILFLVLIVDNKQEKNQLKKNDLFSASRGIVSCRGRDGSLVMVPAISTSFVTASSPGPHPSNSLAGWTNYGQSVTVINSGV